jgi:DNA primase
VWLESQWHEHGVQPWAALREGLREQASGDLALRLMEHHEIASLEDAEESTEELRNLLNRMLIERLKVLETEAINAAKNDPGSLVRYRELQARRRDLEAGAIQPN